MVGKGDSEKHDRKGFAPRKIASGSIRHLSSSLDWHGDGLGGVPLAKPLSQVRRPSLKVRT
jgi:hypothetical protein